MKAPPGCLAAGEGSWAPPSPTTHICGLVPALSWSPLQPPLRGILARAASPAMVSSALGTVQGKGGRQCLVVGAQPAFIITWGKEMPLKTENEGLNHIKGMK